MKFVIEHLEPEVYEWCLIEYEYISKIVHRSNLIFSNIKNKNDIPKLKKYGKVYEKSFSELKLDKICILSQYSDKALTTIDKNKFGYFVVGGILGDNPAKRRTNTITNNLKKNKIKFETRNLGDEQMPTDNAIYVTKKILEGLKLSDLKFVDEIEIEIDENESISLPFRYAVDGNKLVINEKLVEYLRKREEF